MIKRPLQQLYLENDLKKACNNFNNDENLVGEGGFGKVYKGILHGKAIVVKIPKSMNNYRNINFIAKAEQK